LKIEVVSDSTRPTLSWDTIRVAELLRNHVAALERNLTSASWTGGKEEIEISL
jgi:hypothetical protein